MNTDLATPNITSSSSAPTEVHYPFLGADIATRLKVTPLRVIRSEWVKLRTLRSTWALMAIAIGSLAFIGIAACWSTIADFAHEMDHMDHFNPLTDSMVGFELSQLAIGVLGILFMAGEYSTGQIRSSLGAVPKRLPMLFTKAGLFSALTFIVMLPAALISFFVSQRILSAQHIQTTWAAPNVSRSVIGVALYLAVIAIIGVGLGALIRNIAGGISAFVGIMIVIPGIASALPARWADRINKYLPSNAGRALMSFNSDFANTSLSPWRGFALFCGYTTLLIVAAAVMLKRRDA
jgi:ABC-2 type transport system permease protein